MMTHMQIIAIIKIIQENFASGKEGGRKGGEEDGREGWRENAIQIADSLVQLKVKV